MATLTAEKMTLIELAKRTKDGSLQAISEVLNKVNPILDDAIWVQGNGETSHTTTKRTVLPTGSWRKINQGVSQEASRTQQIVEPIGMLEAFSQVDQALVEMAPDAQAFRQSEDLAFIEGMSQTLSTAFFYGSKAASPEEIDGLATRYATLTTATDTVHNVRGAGGTGSDVTSVWIVQWDPSLVHLFYPKNSPSMGIRMTDDGLITIYDNNTTPRPYKAYQSHFRAYLGLAIRDDRAIQRICNIESAGTADFSDHIIWALRNMPNQGAGAVIYANKSVLAQLDVLSKDKTNVQYGAADAFGRPTISFRGFPLRQTDAILNTETALS